MKIAVVGKGGSGKSTVSWLLVNYLANQGKKVLAIDADYNMDLTSNFGLDAHNIQTTIHNTEHLFNRIINKAEETSYKQFSLSHKNKPFVFTLDESYTSTISQKVSNNIKLILGGIGQENVYYSNKCGHAHLSSLKYYLGLLETNEDEFVVVDSIAGLDMVNFGLYAGCDMVICVVENHRNSINVFRQVKNTCDKVGTPVFVIVNKFNHLNLSIEMENLLDECKENIFGYISIKSDLLNYKYTSDLEESLGLTSLISNLQKSYKKIDSWENIRKIDRDKLINNA